jgi:Holin of 3TMs, for gene-transfer release
MFTLLGSFLGFLGSIVPEFFKITQDKRDKFHELEILKLQLEQQRQGASERLEVINTQANIAESQNIYKTFYSGNQSTDKLNSIVRPVIALGFFGLYCLLKIMAYYAVPALIEAPFIVIYQTLWTEEDSAIFAGIISFYFGTRAMNKKRN